MTINLQVLKMLCTNDVFQASVLDLNTVGKYRCTLLHKCELAMRFAKLLCLQLTKSEAVNFDWTKANDSAWSLLMLCMWEDARNASSKGTLLGHDHFVRTCPR